MPDPLSKELTPALKPPPTCAGEAGATWRKRHLREREMVLIGMEDDGTHIWRCPRCLIVWRERP